MSELCQATVAGEKFEAWDSCAPWCNQKAVTTIQLTLITSERIANVWLCKEHADEYYRHHDI